MAQARLPSVRHAPPCGNVCAVSVTRALSCHYPPRSTTQYCSNDCIDARRVGRHVLCVITRTCNVNSRGLLSHSVSCWASTKQRKRSTIHILPNA